MAWRNLAQDMGHIALHHLTVTSMGWSDAVNESLRAQAFMRKLILILMVGVFLAIPFSASAQSDISLSNVVVQLWPGYDQPSMLVIVDFQLAADTSLPATLTFRIPQEANLIAVAASAEITVL